MEQKFFLQNLYIENFCPPFPWHCYPPAGVTFFSPMNVDVIKAWKQTPIFLSKSLKITGIRETFLIYWKMFSSFSPSLLEFYLITFCYGLFSLRKLLPQSYLTYIYLPSLFSLSYALEKYNTCISQRALAPNRCCRVRRARGWPTTLHRPTEGPPTDHRTPNERGTFRTDALATPPTALIT